ncbi:unnamed protein product [Boreogadus saida]
MLQPSLSFSKQGFNNDNTVPPKGRDREKSVGDQRDTDTGGGLSSVQIASRGQGHSTLPWSNVTGEITRETDRPSTLEAVNCRTG